MVSLFNDVGCFFVGNLIFGFHVDLLTWISGHLGFEGSQIESVFYGGTFTLNVTSCMMGLSIYLRTMIVGSILYYWWQHLGVTVARDSRPAARA